MLGSEGSNSPVQVNDETSSLDKKEIRVTGKAFKKTPVYGLKLEDIMELPHIHSERRLDDKG